MQQGGFLAGFVGLCLMAAGPVAAAEPQPSQETGASEQLERYEFLQIQLGLPCRITLYGRDTGTANAAARDAYRRIKQLNAVFSDYDPDSELSRLCRASGPGKPVKVGNDLRIVLTRALDLSKLSGGAFDVT